jgi:nicotinate-nucleotide adenylyltransferase
MSSQRASHHRPALRRQLRIGVYAGAFDPVHAGHITFALQAKQAAHLDQIIFLPERRPRRKPSVEHYAHRVAMLKRALLPHPDLAVMEVVDRQLTVRRTVPMLQALYPGAQFVLLMGSDAVATVPEWQYAERVMLEWEFVVGVRSQHQHSEVEQAVSGWNIAPPCLMIFDSYEPEASSSRIRQALQARQYTQGLLRSVEHYARREWLYVSPAAAIS